jgi:L-threonylcarbamoyladenylate synthase
MGRSGGLLRVTSANLSGEPPALTVNEAVRSLGSFVEIALDGGPAPGGTPSTVANVKLGRLEILRRGAIARKELEAVLK